MFLNRAEATRETSSHTRILLNLDQSLEGKDDKKLNTREALKSFSYI